MAAAVLGPAPARRVPGKRSVLWGFQAIAVVVALTAVFAEASRIWPTAYPHAVGRHCRCTCPRADRKRLAIGRDASLSQGSILRFSFGYILRKS
jgi:hypothetical protein